MKPYDWARRVCADPEMGPMARFVALAMASHAQGAHVPQSRCSLAAIAGWTGLHRATVVRALADLTARGYLVTVKQHAKSGAQVSNLYLLVHPETTPEQVPNQPTQKATPVAQDDRGGSHRTTGVVAQGDRPVAQDDGGSRSGRPHGGRSGRPLEDKDKEQDQRLVLDLMARIADSKRMPRR